MELQLVQLYRLFGVLQAKEDKAWLDLSQACMGFRRRGGWSSIAAERREDQAGQYRQDLPELPHEAVQEACQLGRREKSYFH